MQADPGAGSVAGTDLPPTPKISGYGRHSPRGETPEQEKARRDGGRFTLAEALDERTRARDLVKQGGRLPRRPQPSTFSCNHTLISDW